MLIPLLIASVFYIVQKINTGFYFLPEHISKDNFLLTVIFNKLIKYFAFLFIYQGRNSLSLILIVSIVVFFTYPLKGKISVRAKETIVLFWSLALSVSFHSSNLQFQFSFLFVSAQVLSSFFLFGISAFVFINGS